MGPYESTTTSAPQCLRYRRQHSAWLKGCMLANTILRAAVQKGTKQHKAMKFTAHLPGKSIEQAGRQAQDTDNSSLG